MFFACSLAEDRAVMFTEAIDATTYLWIEELVHCTDTEEWAQKVVMHTSESMGWKLRVEQSKAAT